MPEQLAILMQDKAANITTVLLPVTCRWNLYPPHQCIAMIKWARKGDANRKMAHRYQLEQNKAMIFGTVIVLCQ